MLWSNDEVDVVIEIQNIYIPIHFYYTGKRSFKEKKLLFQGINHFWSEKQVCKQKSLWKSNFQIKLQTLLRHNKTRVHLRVLQMAKRRDICSFRSFAFAFKARKKLDRGAVKLEHNMSRFSKVFTMKSFHLSLKCNHQ